MSDEKRLPSSFDDNPEFEFFEETALQKLKRRLREEPLIPLGCAATCYALYRAYKSMKARDSVELNRMFRARIYAQGFTILAVVAGGIYYKNERQQRREFEKALEARKQQEKRDAWLRELEIRDKEDRDWRERHAAIEAAAREAALVAKGVKKPSPPATTAAATTTTPSTSSEQRDYDTTEAPVEKKGSVLDAVKSLIYRGR
ncbi:altered inheritance of mitochondria protein 31, mitochondrial [Thermoascus aurantiacus ATCC 26904]